MLCIAGKNNIAIEILKHSLKYFDKSEILVIHNTNDFGVDSFQKSFLKYARDNDIKIVSLDEVYEIEDLIFISLEFDKILKPYLFKSKRLYNIHFSLLPKYKGMYTSYWPIRNGEIVSGVTLHQIDEGIDTGDIICQRGFEVDLEMTSKELYLKYIEQGIELVKDNFESIIKGNYSLKQQDYKYSSYNSKKSLDYNNIELDLNQTAFDIKNQVRALNFRNYQLAYFNNSCITHVKITNEKSNIKSGTILLENDLYIKIATIDYNILMYKDMLEVLIKSCKINDKEKINELIKHGYDVNEENTEGYTPLIMACKYGNKEIVEILLNAGADINKTDYKGQTSIMYANDYCKYSGNNEMMNYLISI